MDRTTLIASGIGVAVIGVIIGTAVFRDTIRNAGANTTSTATKEEAPVDNATQLQSEDEVVGTGEEAVTGKTVTVNYTGTFTNGEKFDSSLNPGREPFSFTLGAGGVIQGWDQGVVGMKVGGKRKLTIPSDLAYGPNDYNGIPGGSTLLFDIELLKVE